MKLLCCFLLKQTCQKSLGNWVATLFDKIMILSTFLPSYLPRLFLYFHKTYDHHTEQADDLRWSTTSNKVTWPLIAWSDDHVRNKKRYIYHSARPMVAKVNRQVASDGKMLSSKSHNPLITWTHQVTWQIENVIPPFPGEL